MVAATALVAILLVTLLGTGRAIAEERRYALIIGYNGAPLGDGTETPATLRFADDDAIAFYQLRRQLGDHAILLTSPDSETRRRSPDSVEEALPPTFAALDQAMSRLRAEMQADLSAGRTPVFSFFYSGHGLRGADGQGGLTLLDGTLSRHLLYERVFDLAPASVIHLFVDACHAEEIVRPRDGDAAVVPLTPADVAAFLAQSTLERYPQMGIAIASTRDGSAHEWDLYQSGVFTHEVISALRGAADVNNDGRVEYSELAAFLAAANREVQDPRAHLLTMVRAPVSMPRAPIVDLSQSRGTSRLTRIPAGPESFSVEDSRGNRLADGHPERGSFMSLSLPAGQPLFVRRGDREAELFLQPGTDLGFDQLQFHGRLLRVRGAVESSLRNGLFQAPFGPAYYRGYVDRQDAVAVPLGLDSGPLAEDHQDDHRETPPAGDDPGSGHRWVARRSRCSPRPCVFGGLAWSAWGDNQGAP